MKLTKFRVQNFRSVADSGWLDVDSVTALIGTNEAGKTNLLLPLWKLNPAKEGAIQPTADFPRKLYNSIRLLEDKPIFIDAVFELDHELAAMLSTETGYPLEWIREVTVSRDLGGKVHVNFHEAKPCRTVEAQAVRDVLAKASEGVASVVGGAALRDTIVSAIQTAIRQLPAVGGMTVADIDVAVAGLRAISVDPEEEPETETASGAAQASGLSTGLSSLREALEDVQQKLDAQHPNQSKTACSFVLRHLPKFVYYSNYGNLDSEIYLPHVIENMDRPGLGTKESAKVRTLRVLFEFVRLQPTEIHALGKDVIVAPQKQVDAAQIAAVAEKKKERSILLQSASTQLTQEFRSWWRQGDYRFRFEADGDHFRIWVSDDRRPEEVELEGRSTGLQWFLSFYLVFLVEAAKAHSNCILLLDEPGLSLHPLSQRDLSKFFESLSETNQIMYTTHSPFLVDADHLERARKVYVAGDGTTKATADLRGGDADASQRGASYAVHAAVGLTVAESLLVGCRPVIVEGHSDQLVLSAIKTLLIASGRLRPGRELVFPCGNGVKGIRPVASIVSATQDGLPPVLVDGDEAGRRLVKQLQADLYAATPERVIDLQTVLDVPDAEVEDLLPPQLVAKELDRWLRPEVSLEDELKTGHAIVPQIELWAASQGLTLPSGWKVELAKRVKHALLKAGATGIDDATFNRWAALFEKFGTQNRKA